MGSLKTPRHLRKNLPSYLLVIEKAKNLELFQKNFRTFDFSFPALYNEPIKSVNGGHTMQAEISYIPCGDYFVPNLHLDDEPRPIGRWGRLRRNYLKKQRAGFYSCLILRGTLWSHLADIND